MGVEQSNTGTIQGDWKMISVKELMYDIYELLPDVEMQEEDRIEELIIQGASKLYNHKYYERVVCLKFVNEHRAELPSEYLAIRSVLGAAYNCDSVEQMSSLSSDTSDTNTILQLVSGTTVDATTADADNTSNIQYDVDLKDNLTLESLNNARINWKYLHKGTSILQQLDQQLNRLTTAGCLNDDNSNVSSRYCEQCDHLFSVDTLGRLVTTMHTGLVLVEYYRLPKNDNGDLLIPYHHDLQDAINAYVLYKLFVKSFNQGRQNAVQKMQYWQQQWQMYYLNVKNSLVMPSLSEQIHAIQNRDMLGTHNIQSVYNDYVMNPTIRF